MTKSLMAPKVSSEKSKTFLTDVALSLYQELDTPKSLAAFLLLSNNEIGQLIDLSVDPLDYCDAGSFSKDYQVVSFLKKAEWLDSGINTSEVALEKFLDSERQCRDHNDHHFAKTRPISGVLMKAQAIIASILGNLPSVEDGSFHLGPGATSALSGSSVTVMDKLQQRLICTRESAQQVIEFYSKVNPRSFALSQAYPFSGEVCALTASVDILPGNSLHFVPKSAKTDRPICIEPHSLTPLQKFYGNEIRWRLLKVGIDLNKQWKRNRILAKNGSVDGSYATIDLSSASDTISSSLVMDLLPLPWFEVLSSLRCARTKLPDGTWIENEKFSSMGNGFTFELETLIFYALSKAVAIDRSNTKEISVFGDDIVVASELSKDLINVLELCGFSINYEKTFIDGPFRESCGEDYFLGQNVRPYFQKRSLSFETDKFRVANGLRHWCCRIYDNIYCSPELYTTWNRIITSIPKPFRAYGPAHIGDSCIHVSRQEYSEIKVCRRPYNNGLLRVSAFVAVSKKTSISKYSTDTQRAAILYGCKERPSLREVVGYRSGVVQPVHWDWVYLSWG